MIPTEGKNPHRIFRKGNSVILCHKMSGQRWGEFMSKGLSPPQRSPDKMTIPNISPPFYQQSIKYFSPDTMTETNPPP